MDSFFEQAKWLIVTEFIYVLFIIVVSIRIIFDTRSVSKTLAYLLLVFFIPVFGVVFYFSFGINYRKRKIYSQKLEIDEKLKKELEETIATYNKSVRNLDNPSIRENMKLIKLIANPKAGNTSVLPNYAVEVFQNGENLYPVMLDELRKAKQHIHIEYYIYENDTIGNQIKDILIEKVKEGVEVRFIYDDFGSKGIRKNIARELREAGVLAHPFNRIRWILLANRLNYRNHRKIVVIDGETSFVGGINVCDKYINPSRSGLYWRDTHLMIKGYSSLALQRVFLSDWNFCSGENILINTRYFPLDQLNSDKVIYTQIVSCGPDSDLPNILYSVNQAINSAKEEILLVTPYFIPETSLQESLIVAALSGIDVRILVPLLGDSKIVNMASQAYFGELLAAGVKIYLYEKGFVHSKTFVIDKIVASVGTANLDLRSFDLNFEVSALIYDEEIAQKMTKSFYEDIKNARQMDYERWKNRSKFRKFSERFVRLISPFM